MPSGVGLGGLEGRGVHSKLAADTILLEGRQKLEARLAFGNYKYQRKRLLLRHCTEDSVRSNNVVMLDARKSPV